MEISIILSLLHPSIVKQLRLVHGIPRQEREAAAGLCRGNALESMAALLSARPVLPARLKAAAERVASAAAATPPAPLQFSPELASDMAALWADERVRGVAAVQAGELQLLDSAHYFLEAVERLAEPEYLPTDEDILRNVQTRHSCLAYCASA